MDITLLGDKKYGPTGDSIDIISVIATIFDLANIIGIGGNRLMTDLINQSMSQSAPIRQLY
ncbi:BCCT family transporter [uncultured Sunxiuqinia sp.]|uniref:BCCT family transporter n=1 Tax=uncultured Sunxiuqinia sp. TaxID=1573825 RepID=UPI00262017AC|nr:BCCT family transporter [uncultured Sunxiuqinia sp.]